VGKDGDWFGDGVLANSSSQEIVSKCKGLYFRYSRGEYISYGLDNRLFIEKRESYRILKRMSCLGGCGKRCLKDLFEDDIVQVPFEDVGIVYPDNPKHGDLYRLCFAPGSKDWETGCIDEWKWVFEKVDEIKDELR
jgi:hypothetical protein